MNIKADLERIKQERRAETAPAFHVVREQPRQDRQPRESYLPDIHRILPSSEEAEKGVLSSIMNAAMYGPAVAKKSMFYAEGQIGQNHFHFSAHREIWKAMQFLHKENEPLDFITITNELDGAKLLDQCGGASYVTEIETFVPTHANLEYYIEILKEKRSLRQIVELGTMLVSGAYDHDDPAFIIDEATTTLKAIQTAKRIGELPDLDDMTNLIGENMPEAPAELVKGILHRGSKMIIGGTSKGRKTFSLIDLAISVSTGTQWWGLPTIKGKVCYINFEIQRPFFARRFADICQKKKVMPEPGMFKCWTLRGFSEGLEKMSANLIKILLQEDYVLIVFDPIYKALGDRDENKAGDVASMLNELEAIAVKTGAAIAFGAHYSKGNQAAKDAMDRIGGSGVFARDPDAILTMTPHATEECFTVDATLRNFPPQKPFVVKWDWPLFERDDTEDPESIKQPKRAKFAGKSGQFDDLYSPDDIVEILKECGDHIRTEHLRERCTTRLGGSKETFYRKWKLAQKDPSVMKSEIRKGVFAFCHISNIK